MFGESLEAIANCETRLDDIVTELDEKRDEFNEEEQAVYLDEDDNTKLNKKKIQADAKSRADVESETKEKLQSIVALWDEQKKLIKDVKAAKIELAKLTEEKINNLTDEEVEDFLDRKWVIPVCIGIENVMRDTLAALERKLVALAAKYEVSYNEINTSLTEAEDGLAKLVSQLTGDEWALKGLNELLNSKEA
jgi:type I restriction enzyme M protein